MSDLQQDIEDLERLEQLSLKKASALANLLDEKLRQQDRYIGLRTEMGITGSDYGSPTYVMSWVATHTLEWVGRNLKMGSQMPFMENYIDDHGRVQVDEHNAEELKQRAPDWTRQPELASYLIHDKQRKFSTIVAVVCPPWVDDPKSGNWGVDGRAVRNAIDYEALDTEGRLCLIDLSNTLIYALDGQHRVMGIQGVMAVRDNGFLELKRRDGTSTNKTFTRQELLDRFRVEIGELQALLTESISVEYIPAVVAGETREEANRRIRDVFVCINSYAKKTKPGETILLDESDGFSIAARRIGTLHSLFKSEAGDRVNWASNSITRSAPHITTLDAIRTIAEHYLPTIDSSAYAPWRPLFTGQVPLRPTEQELADANVELTALFDLIESMPVFQRILRGDNVVDIREFQDEQNPQRIGHLMLRPIGQQVFARAVARIIGGGAMSPDQIRSRLAHLDQEGAFRLSPPENLWYGVLYDRMRNSIITRGENRELATKLMVYLLKGGEEHNVRKDLLRDVITNRMDEKGERWLDFDGDWSKKAVEDADLPPP